MNVCFIEFLGLELEHNLNFTLLKHISCDLRSKCCLKPDIWISFEFLKSSEHTLSNECLFSVF